MGRSHTHEWRPLDEDDPVFEDGAAIFRQQCDHVEILGSQTSSRHDETFYEEGAQCPETQHIRMDMRTLGIGDDTFTFAKCVNDWFSRNEDHEDFETVESAVMEIEQAMRDGEGEIDEIDPDATHGRVVAEYNDITAIYTPNGVEE
ncbi:hypothetical protein [Natrinema sp. DC36]|uniref:hypothetical protein n=1 Tax=Natrinema sp. DC36 TaxID=2878680 RepID=UPI001CF0CDFD|nr:hypothetical protein [Natrinema sp. DC36]